MSTLHSGYAQITYLPFPVAASPYFYMAPGPVEGEGAHVMPCRCGLRADHLAVTTIESSDLLSIVVIRKK